MKRLLSYALLATTMLTAAACGDVGTGPTSFSGRYTLRSIDGRALPATLYYTSPSDHVEILASDITLNDDGTYSDRARVQETRFGPTQVYDDTTLGTWYLSGSQLTLEDRLDRTHVTYATLSNNSLIIDRFGGYNARAEYVR